MIGIVDKTVSCPTIIDITVSPQIMNIMYYSPYTIHKVSKLSKHTHTHNIEWILLSRLDVDLMLI